MRLYTAGIADFERIRQDGRIYVDKTDLIYKLSHESQFVFLSRPRRFGKSLLCSTLKYYFQGRKDLFEGLAIAELEKNWLQYPVLHFDMSACKNLHEKDEIYSFLDSQLHYYENIYGRLDKDMSLGMRLNELIHRACKLTGQKIVIIVDEYDAPLLNFLHDPQQFEEINRILREFYQQFKISDAYEKFVFITGLTELYYDASVNNIIRMSHSYQCDALCGITMDELQSVFYEEIQMLADEHRCSKKNVIEMLHLHYGGYRFGNEPLEIFNPYCLMKVFDTKQVDDFWFSNEMLTFISKQLEYTDKNWIELDLPTKTGHYGLYKPVEEKSSFAMLYENGIFGIKDYCLSLNQYSIDFPNQEAKKIYQQLQLIKYMS